MSRGRPAQRFEFEGEALTVAQIHERVPCLTRDAIRAHLAKGRTTRLQMLTGTSAAFRSSSARAAGRRGWGAHDFVIGQSANL